MGLPALPYFYLLFVSFYTPYKIIHPKGAEESRDVTLRYAHFVVLFVNQTTCSYHLICVAFIRSVDYRSIAMQALHFPQNIF